jgi:hypothetical protein
MRTPRSTIISTIYQFSLLFRTEAAAAALTLATCGSVLLLLIHAQSSKSSLSSSVAPTASRLVEKALELLRDVDAKSVMPLHVHAQVMAVEAAASVVVVAAAAAAVIIVAAAAVISFNMSVFSILISLPLPLPDFK